jgi:uncharacterized coiled-coil DUF342 family protein
MATRNSDEDSKTKYPTWKETISEFKGTRTTTKARAKELIESFNEYLEKLGKCKSS